MWQEPDGPWKLIFRTLNIKGLSLNLDVREPTVEEDPVIRNGDFGMRITVKCINIGYFILDKVLKDLNQHHQF